MLHWVVCNSRADELSVVALTASADQNTIFLSITNLPPHTLLPAETVAVMH
jgi:hypothetical protein